MGQMLENQRLMGIYRRLAAHYDWLSRLYYLIGFRYTGYRKLAVSVLDLRPGDTVVEIGCGTGANFPLLQRAVGPTGNIIGVDLTDAMLDQARRRVAQAGWTNVELVHSDALAYQFPLDIDGVISTYALTLSADYGQVIANGAQALKAGKHWVALDFKAPKGCPRWLVKIGILFIRPFGGKLEMVGRHPWEWFPRYLEKVHCQNLYLGIAYIVCGEAKLKRPMENENE